MNKEKLTHTEKHIFSAADMMWFAGREGDTREK